LLATTLGEPLGQRGCVHVGAEPKPNRRAGLGSHDDIHLRITRWMRLHREQLDDVEQLRQQRPASTITGDERGAKQRVGVQRQQRWQCHDGTVGQRNHAWMATCLIVAVVGRQLERLADRPARSTSVGTETFELANARATPRPLDEVVGARLQ
jgi:hypothetical protein